ncbi:MAG: DUF4149 domain-containing protein [Gammaproteobacteria bacterium]|nr:MAG: DUF4149 domain-containing protein [Gammaproteobacteria bacterium]
MSQALLLGLHLLAAAAWVGGMLFLALVLLPAARATLPPEEAGALLEAAARRLALVGWGCLGVLAVTGGLLLARSGAALDEPAFWTGPAGRVLALKLLLVGLLVGVEALHDFVLGPRGARLWREAPASAAAQRLRRGSRWLARAALLLSLGVAWQGLALAGRLGP